MTFSSAARCSANLLSAACAPPAPYARGEFGYFSASFFASVNLRVEVVGHELLVELEQHAFAFAGFRRALLAAFQCRGELLGGERDVAEVHPGVSEVRISRDRGAEQVVRLGAVAAVECRLARFEGQARFGGGCRDGDFLHRGETVSGAASEMSVAASHEACFVVMGFSRLFWPGVSR